VRYTQSMRMGSRHVRWFRSTATTYGSADPPVGRPISMLGSACGLETSVDIDRPMQALIVTFAAIGTPTELNSSKQDGPQPP
jgi:hypothetical protein